MIGLGWLAIEHETEVHVMTEGEEHSFEGCKCKPTLDDEYMVITHNSFDGREAFENGERFAS